MATDQMIVGVSVYSDVLTSESNVSLCRYMRSFAPTMQNKLAMIRGSVYLQAYNTEGIDITMSSTRGDVVAAEGQHVTSYDMLRLEFEKEMPIDQSGINGFVINQTLEITLPCKGVENMEEAEKVFVFKK